MPDRYFAFRPEVAGTAAPYELHYRMDGDEKLLVGARVLDGPIHFVDAWEGPRHVQAIWDAAQETVRRIKSAHIAGIPEAALTTIAPYIAEAENAQIERYLADVRQIMAQREAEIGTPDSDLAPSLAASMMTVA